MMDLDFSGGWSSAIPEYLVTEQKGDGQTFLFLRKIPLLSTSTRGSSYVKCLSSAETNNAPNPLPSPSLQ